MQKINLLRPRKNIITRNALGLRIVINILGVESAPPNFEHQKCGIVYYELKKYIYQKKFEVIGQRAIEIIMKALNSNYSIHKFYFLW